jgi:hypothetical protein
MSDSFTILRRDADGYSTRGPIAAGMSLKDARSEIVRLKKAYPYQDFVIMGEVGEVSRSDRVSVKIEAPDLAPAPRKERKPRKTVRVEPVVEAEPAAKPVTAANVVPLRKEGTA